MGHLHIFSIKQQASPLSSPTAQSSLPGWCCARLSTVNQNQEFHLEIIGKNNTFLQKQNVCTGLKTARNHGNHQNFDPTLLAKKLWLVCMRMKKKIKMVDLKKAYFSKRPILKIFLQKFHGLVLWLVESISAKGICGAQPKWLWGCPT